MDQEVDSEEDENDELEGEDGNGAQRVKDTEDKRPEGKGKKRMSTKSNDGEPDDNEGPRDTQDDQVVDDEVTELATQKRKSKRNKRQVQKAEVKAPKAAESVERNADGLIAKPSNFSAYRSWSAVPEIDPTKIASLKVRRSVSTVYRFT